MAPFAAGGGPAMTTTLHRELMAKLREDLRIEQIFGRNQLAEVARLTVENEGLRARLTAAESELQTQKELWRRADARWKAAEARVAEMERQNRAQGAVIEAARAEYDHDCRECRNVWCDAREVLVLRVMRALDAAAPEKPWYCPHQEHSTGDCNQFCECEERIRSGTYGAAAPAEGGS